MKDDLIKPMKPVLIKEAFDDEKYLYQIKWDGIRILAAISERGVRLHTKNGLIATEKYPELQALKGLLKGDRALLDGEVVVFGDKGIPSFNKILKRHLVKGASQELIDNYPILYVVFDILFINGKDLTRESLLKRQEVLEKVLRIGGNIAICDNYKKGTELFKIMESKGMEGIVQKERQGQYYPGEKNKTWLKAKCRREMNAVVGGIGLKEGRASTLLLGLWEGKKLQYIGRASTGIKEETRMMLNQAAKEYGTSECPFSNPPRLERALKAVWLPPKLLVQVQYLEWSEQGVLRNPVILGFV